MPLAVASRATALTLLALATLASVGLTSPRVAAQEAETEGDWPDGKWQVAFDAIGATVHVPVPVRRPTATGSTVTIEDAKIGARSFSLGASYGITESFRVGVQLPWTSSSIEVAGFSRTTSSFGNLEVDGWYERALGELAAVTFGLGLAGGGQGKSSSTSQTDADRSASNHAASGAHGRSFDARYESGRSSVVPSIELDWFRNGVQLEPYLRAQLLHDVTGEAPNPNVVTTETGARVAYRWWGVLDTGLRAWWFAIPVGNEGTRSSIALEPELRARVGHFTPLLGVIVPVYGPLTSPRVVAGELGVSVDF